MISQASTQRRPELETATLMAMLPVTPMTAQRRTGWSVALSSDGQTLAVGAPHELYMWHDTGNYAWRHPTHADILTFSAATAGGGALPAWLTMDSDWPWAAHPVPVMSGLLN